MAPVYYFLAVGLGFLAFLHLKGKARTKLAGELLCAYCVLILSSTLLSRTRSEELRYNIQPFWTYIEMVKGGWRAGRLFEQLLLNVAMFIPIGFLLTMLAYEGKFLTIFLWCSGISGSIEILQLLTKRGLFEFDDILHNTIGALIGYAIYKLRDFLKTLKRRD